MARYALTLAALAGAAQAATTTVSLIAPQLTGAPLAGSVISAGKDATTYAVACADSADGSKTCDAIDTQTIIQGPSTWEMNYSVGGGDAATASAVNDAKCSVDFSANVAQCAVTISENLNGNVISTVMTTQITAVDEVLVPVTITAGADKLTGGSGGNASSPTTSAGNWSTTALPPTSVNKGTPPSPTGPTTTPKAGPGVSSSQSLASSSAPVPPSNSAPGGDGSSSMTTAAADEPSMTAAAGRVTGSVIFAGVAAALGALLAL